MTEHQQPKEYIITESELEDLHAMSHGAYERQVIEIHQRVHTRPHTPAPAATHFIIDAGLRADVAETLRMAGCPSLACRVLDDTMPDYQINAERERFAKGLIEYSNRMGIYNCEEAVGDYLESLRNTNQQAGDERK